MRYKKILITTLFLFLPIAGFFFTVRALIEADTTDEPYSILVVSGQSWAEGSNAFRHNLEDGNGFDKKNDVADSATQIWWAGADGRGPTNVFEFLDILRTGESMAGWMFSGGNSATGAQRMKTLADQQRADMVGPEFGIGREIYRQGRRKVIILKVSYGFQSLAQSESTFIPYDFNVNSTNKSYQMLKTQFNQLTSYLRTSGKKYTVDGFFWLQGGTDAIEPKYTPLYEQNFRDFTNAVRTDLEMHPDSHFVAVKFNMHTCLEKSYPLTGYYCGFPWAAQIDPSPVIAVLETAHANFAQRVKTVRGALQTVADDDRDARVKIDVVEVNDVAMSNDAIHHSELGNIEIGRRMVNMYRLPFRTEGSNDYDNDGIVNSSEDTGTACPPHVNGNGGSKANNGNLGDDDCDNDGYPNYLDRIFGTGSGLSQ